MNISPGQRDGYVAAQRAVARRLHPDLGGDPQQYVAAMAALDGEYRDRQHAGVPTSGPYTTRGVVQVVARHRVRSTLRVTARQAVACVRGVLPRGWPGARRYAQL
ncbi:MAG: hypothetical protein M3Y49_11715 [Actinomycetota bacterium]|nr:hypothetical protein [Actinomycetota bacterium]